MVELLWLKKEINLEEIDKKRKEIALSEEYNYLVETLVNRGIDIDYAGRMISDPYSFIKDDEIVNGKEAAEKILSSIKNKKHVEIFGDYDVDGMTSSYVLADYLSNFTDDINVYLPERTEGYGLSMEFCKKVVEEYPDKNVLIITVDNGIAKVKEVEYLKENGIDIIITDHHMPDSKLPNTLIVNPHIVEDGDYHYLSGCGVAYKLINEINKIIKENYDTDIDIAEQYMDILAISTLADVMPLTPENTAFIKIGIDMINNNNGNKGIMRMLEKSYTSLIDSKTILFNVAPKLNGCGRMNCIYTAANMLYKTDNDELDQNIKEIEAVNRERKKIVNNAVKKFEVDTSNKVVLAGFEDKNVTSGLVGIIANKLLDKYNRPTMAYSIEDGIGKGSARSNIDLLSVLRKHKDLFIELGGHEKSFGFTFDLGNKDKILEAINTSKELESLRDDTVNVPDSILIDSVIGLNKVNKGFYNKISAFPLGKKLPVFRVNNLKVISVKESSNNKNNIQLDLFDTETEKSMSLWAFGLGEKYNFLNKPDEIDIVGSLEEDFMRKGRIVLRIMDFRESKK